MIVPRADKNGDNVLANFQYYYYEPALSAAAIFTVLFGFSTLLHAYQMGRTKTWFMIPFLIGGIFETIGYIGRILSAQENPGPYTLGPFILQSVLLLVAPALFAASIYMELSRIVQMCDGDHALFVRRTWLTKIFVGGDILSFLMQAAGAGLLSSGSSSSINTGSNIVVGGLVVQVLFFGLFVITAALFHIRHGRNPTAKSRGTPWKKHLIGLYIVSVLIFVRSIVRVIEYAEGYAGYIMAHEIFLYLFDAVVMWLAMVTMNWIHPSEVAALLRGGGSERAFTNAWKLERIGQRSAV